MPWALVSGDVVAGSGAEVVVTARVVPGMCRGPEEGMTLVGLGDLLELRPVRVVSEPGVLVDVELVVVGVAVEMPVLAEDGAVVVEVCGPAEVEGEEATADVTVLPVG